MPSYAALRAGYHFKKASCNCHRAARARMTAARSARERTLRTETSALSGWAALATRCCQPARRGRDAALAEEDV